MVEYLNKFYPIQKYTDEITIQNSDLWNSGTIRHHFFTIHGINIQIEGIYYQFKYEMCVVSKWSNLNKESRGIILSKGDEKWKIVSRPLDKFYNQEESECPIDQNKKFQKICTELIFSEKADGSCIQLWYCGEENIKNNFEFVQKEGKDDERYQKEMKQAAFLLQNDSPIKIDKIPQNKSQPIHTAEEKRGIIFQRTGNKDKPNKQSFHLARSYEGWRVSTLGKITPASLFEDAFFELLGDGIKFIPNLEKNVTYLFEVCTEKNRVVTKYPNDRVYIIGARNNEDGSLFSQQKLNELKNGLKAKLL